MYLYIYRPWSWFSHKLSNSQSEIKAHKEVSHFSSEVNFARQKKILKVPTSLTLAKEKEPISSSTSKDELPLSSSP